MRFPDKAGMSQIICICMLPMTAFFLHNYPLTAYYVPYDIASISSNIKIQTIVIFSQISTGYMDLFFFFFF